MDLATLLQATISGLMFGLVLSLIAVGLTLVWGVMDVLNFAHCDFLMIAMFSSLLLFTNMGIDPLFSLPISVGLLFVIGLLTFHFVLRPVLGHPTLLITFGLSILIRNLVLFFVGPDFRVINESLLAGKKIILWKLHLSLPQVVASFGCILISYLVYLLVSKTKFGRAIRATALDKETAVLMGINTNRIFALTFALGAACVGVAGGLLVNFYYVFPEVGFSFVILAFVIVTIGGMGNIQGAFFGGILIGLVQILGGFLVGTQYKNALVVILYLIIISFRPKGLFGW